MTGRELTMTFDEARAFEELTHKSLEGLSFAFRIAVVCDRCNARRDRWPAGEPCCTWRGAYRGRHRKVGR